MGAETGIQWADATVNFWTGCTKLTPACDFCYAEAEQDKRFHRVKWGSGQARHRFKGAVALCFQLERKAIREGRRLRVFVNSLSDTFDAEVPDAWRDEIFAVAALCPHLDFLLLTKRHKVMREYVESHRQNTAHRAAFHSMLHHIAPRGVGSSTHEILREIVPWPLPNVHLGVTAEDQPRADLRLPDLCATPAARRFVSYEPALGQVDWSPWLPFLAQIIFGGESGSNARPPHPNWARSTRDQCAAAGVPFFFKQWGSYAPSGIFEAGRASLHDMQWVGKKAAGRLLDGVEHNGVPDGR